MTAINKFTNQLRKLNKNQYFFLVVFLMAFILRFYNLEGSVQFQGDQGRDSIIVADIFRQLDPVFIGPVTSVGNMYLGPLYYYFMLPFLWLSYPSPMGPIYAVAFLGAMTVFAVFYVGKKMFDERTAIIASSLFAFSATVLNNTRFSWNPNPAPLVSIFMIYFTYKAWKDHPKYWMLVSVFFSILIQLHYLTLLSLGGAGLIWLFSLIGQLQKDKKIFSKIIIEMIKFSLISIFIFLLSLTPLFLFDLKHDSLNRKAFTEMVTGKTNFKQSSESSLAYKTGKILKETEGRGMHILFEITIGKNRQLNQFLLYSTYLILISIFVYYYKKIKSNDASKNDNNFLTSLVVVLAYLGVGIIGTSAYEHTIFDHYIAYLFPITFLVFGIIFGKISRNFIGFLFLIIVAIFYLQYNIPLYPLKTLGWTIRDIEMTADRVYDLLQENEKYNIVLLSESGDHYGQNYRYFLTTKKNPPVNFGSLEEIETLVIINEEKATNDVVNLPIYDIVVFPNKNISDFYKIENGPEITVLRK